MIQIITIVRRALHWCGLTPQSAERPEQLELPLPIVRRKVKREL